MGTVVQIKNLEIGEGTPKICVPVMGSDKEEIRQAAEGLKGEPFDLVEWRADFYGEINQPDAVREALELLREILGECPLLFTIRTKAEGGACRIEMEDYLNVNLAVVRSGLADLIDVEILRGDDVAFMLIEEAHQAGVKVIASNHDFGGTPKKEEILMRLCKMQELEADIAKMAVMPQTERDVLTLLDATLTMKELHNETPIVTMSMGKMGVLSRLTGEIFGSAITFGCVGEPSAPGQIPVQELKTLMRTFH